MAKKKDKGFLSKVLNFAEEHEREIELGGEIALSVITGVLAFRAGMRVQKTVDVVRVEIDDLKDSMGELDSEEKKAEFEATKKEIIKEGVKECALPVLAPVATCGGVIFCAAKGYKDANKVIASLSAAYTFAQSELIDYKDAATKLLGDSKETELEEEVTKEKIAKNPPENSEVIITGKGDVLCYDDYSGRYFNSTAENIRKAENEINRRLIDEYYVSLNDFYDELGLPSVRMGNDLGFCVDDRFSITISTTLSPDDRPCLRIGYTVSPKYGYGDLGGPRFSK